MLPEKVEMGEDGMPDLFVAWLLLLKAKVPFSWKERILEDRSLCVYVSIHA